MKIAFLFLVVVIFLLPQLSFSQLITTSSAMPVADQPVTITFDASQGNAALKDYTGAIYAHTGVITDKSTSSSDWKYVIAGWS
jgi:hypothetical protein